MQSNCAIVGLNLAQSVMCWYNQTRERTLTHFDK
jgi:hypothetical protein